MRRSTGKPQRDVQVDVEEVWTVKPLNQDHRHGSSLESSSSSSSPSGSASRSQGPGPSTSKTHRNSVPRNHKIHRKANPNWKNQRGQVKFQFVKKSEVVRLPEEVGSLSINDEVDVPQEKTEEENRGGSLNTEVREEAQEREEDRIQSRLDESLKSSLEEELPEEQLTINDQLQEDELLVMESIYGENIFNLDRKKGLRGFQVHVHIEVPCEILVTAKLNSPNEVESKHSKSDDFLYSFNVQYIPPLVLTCILPKTYPSHQPPIFAISVRWLDSMSISSLCSKLDSIWTEQQGQEVLYQWVEWLQGSSLSYLGFDKEIKLGPYGMKHAGDKRALSGIVSPDVDIPSIRSYNDERHHKNFCIELHKCCICFNEYPGTEFVRLPCKHFFCWKCLQTYTDIHVKEGTINNLECLEAKCGVMIPPSILKRLLSDEEHERWESLMLEKTLATMPDIAYCPRCQTPCIEDDDQHAQCSKCFFSFCTLCRERRHVGVACMTPEMKLLILQERQKSSQLKEDQKRKEREMINDILSMKEIHRDSKQCPSCKMAISRTEGCNKMECYNCGQYFCYRCSKAIAGYEHFRDGTCELFPQEMIHAWEERINPRQAFAQAQAELFAEHGMPCPNCRQFNAKVGNNNHMFCWACQTHYCYLCKKIVRRSSEHYGPRGCKQHTQG
ncbi:hypothetical protein L6164_005543 [Bauhinia variegata]|uniref:Uncharacterized protein n=1 Tax=Bauhinia variegata TaxID=167791 RepID=A0ACB9PR67_BAUVA|nr:hypothetical protein L6164_005543 [Bauhinia variegata]